MNAARSPQHRRPTELPLTTNGDAAPTHLLDVTGIGGCCRCDEAAEAVVVRESSLAVQWSVAVLPG